MPTLLGVNFGGEIGGGRGGICVGVEALEKQRNKFAGKY